MKEEDKDLLAAKNLARRLDAGLQEIDPRTLERLRRARMAALKQRPQQSWFSGLSRYQLTPARFSLAALAFLVVTLLAVLPARAPRSLTAEDLEIVTSKEQVAMLEELDFYRWLAVSGENRAPAERSR
jgi:hypothetical protein